MKNELTPGPWQMTDKPNDRCCWSYHVETVERGKILGDVLEGAAIVVADVRNEADAKLIAAAPDLLDALKTLVGLPDFSPKEKVDAAWKAAKAAIAKAEVRS